LSTQIAVVGLGRMGANIARRLMRSGHSVVVHDLDSQAIEQLVNEGATGAEKLEDLARLPSPRTVWLMLPAGIATEITVSSLKEVLESGDIVIDGGNTYWKDDLRRAHVLADHGIRYIDVGTSGGIGGLENGFCLTVGGPKNVVDPLQPIWAALATDGGYVHAGPSGAGHFVKMVHNAIEYGVMQAYAEGFDILRNAASHTVAENERFDLDVAAIAKAWQHGSVIRSWLLDLSAAVIAKDPQLAKYSGVVADSGEGRWALMAAIEERVPAEVLAAALHARFRSQRDHTYAEKLLSALREAFGGHAEPRKP
jgi:6-phosphogluconate dehydrogenase